ncbi:hypothetical protein Vretimale_502 [Volvox reticuliferus]|uniref:Uncharacterized protein n=1 Tax=Volvox reticuliferus TaxID=1737510 RepID=A0A8J4D3H1_9CHLO|nr:hypothetical protein Vretifemale_2533 [Volvox reticuliferus]GIL94250.1 hypothetical protein Vretimale_502 [Volvox reticuliferus]
MQRSLRALVSRCVGAGCGSLSRVGQVQDAGATQAWDACLEASRFSCSASVPSRHLLTAATSSAGAAGGGGLAAGFAAPRDLTRPFRMAASLWMLKLAQTPNTAQLPLLPHAMRTYAKAAKAAKAAGATAPVAASGPKKPRVSWTKLYSCRNDRLRHTHEQIWPTMQLTEAELAMFRRNSRLFVVEMGKSISLQTKYRMGLQVQNPEEVMDAASGMTGDGAQASAGSSRRVPYQQARSLLHESQLHLDALGENPRYLKVRRVRSLYAAKLQNLRKLRLLLGFRRRHFVQRMYEHALVCRGSHRMWKLVCAMEANTAMFLTRMGLADDSVAAVRALRDGKVYVNGRRPDMPHRGYLLPGDVVSPAAGAVSYFRQRVAKSLLPLEADVVRYVM